MSAHDLLTGRTIIVTGGATGIGQVFAVGCAEQGADVVVADLNPADETVGLITRAGGRRSRSRSTSPTTRRPGRWPRRRSTASGGSTGWSKQLAEDIARRVRTGQISVNTWSICSTQPFGGYKSSGIGREGGVESLEPYLETKVIHGLDHSDEVASGPNQG